MWLAEGTRAPGNPAAPSIRRPSDPPHRGGPSKIARPASRRSRSPAPAQAWNKLTGYKFTEVVNQTNAFLQGPATEADKLGELKEGVREGKFLEVRLLNYTKGGDPFYNTLKCHPLRDANGKLTHYCGVLEGEPVPEGQVPKRTTQPLLPAVAARRQKENAEAAADEAAAGPAAKRPKRQGAPHVLLADALANSTNAVVMTQPTPPYAITHVNQPWCEMCGYTLEEVEGLTNAILQGPDTDKELVNELMASVRRGEGASATLVNYKKGGVRFVNNVTVQPVYNEEDELEQFMAMLHEVDAPAKRAQAAAAAAAEAAAP